MRSNVGKLERATRLLIGLALLSLYGPLPSPWRYFALIGLVPLGTALTGFCPIYAALGRNHCRHPERGS